MDERKTKIFYGAVLLVLGPLAFFYLFVFPALVATRTIAPTGGAVAFGAFLYLQLWMLTSEYAYTSAAALYRFRRQHLWFFLQPGPGLKGFRLELSRKLERRRQISGLETAFSCGLSYLFTIYGFAVAYTFVSRADAKAFNVGDLDIFSAMYFSLVTAATVGYGDIAPVSVTARSLVMAEVVVSLLYAVFFFSVLASAVRDGGPRGTTAEPGAAGDERSEDGVSLHRSESARS